MGSHLADVWFQVTDLDVVSGSGSTVTTADGTEYLDFTAGIAVVSLPMCNLYLQDRAPGRTPRRRGITLLHELAARGIPLALATDFNPGTSPTPSLPLVMTVACLSLRLTPSEALAAVTVNAAAALGIGDEVGTIEPGRQADLAVWGVPTHRQIPYWPGADLVRAVVKRGRIVLERTAAGSGWA